MEETASNGANLPGTPGLKGSICLRSAQHPAFPILSPDKLQGEGNGHPEGFSAGKLN
jgi:hypothetical protein